MCIYIAVIKVINITYIVFIILRIPVMNKQRHTKTGENDRGERRGRGVKGKIKGQASKVKT